VSDSLPSFDPYELLGVDASADAATIDRAYKSRIRFVHPDIAGASGLDESKRLNVAREWLLDPKLRAQLPPPARRWGSATKRATPPPRASAPARPPDRSGYASWPTSKARTRGPSWDYDPFEDDPLTFDYGSSTDRLRSFFDSMRTLSSDERARVTYSLGDEPPFPYDEFLPQVGDELWGRSRALNDAIERVWEERRDESPPLLFPRGRVFGSGMAVADLYAQWALLGDAVGRLVADGGAVEAMAARSSWPWTASVGETRYGRYEEQTRAFLDDARGLSAVAAERLSRSWHRSMDGYLYGKPGEDWFPGVQDRPKVDLVSARLAAVDASRIFPPEGLPGEHHNGFHYGLRLTAHVVALGGVEEAGRDYLRPWRDALDETPSFADRARWGLPTG
jgi:curved DNA-binding protein CbpA